MKPIHKEILLAAFLGLVLPWLLVNTVLSMEKKAEKGGASETPAPEQTEATVDSEPIRMRFRDGDGKVTEMEMDAYLTGVLLAELPASFEQEAKRAQAVAARTFALKAAVTGGKHGDGSVCASSYCCQAYIRPEDYLAAGGTEEALSLARQAAADTSGLVLCYEGTLIEATYFSCSGGSTEDAVAVWGADYPYLRAVESPGEEDAPRYSETVSFTPEEFEAALGTSLSGSPEDWFGFTTYTAGGGVNTMRIGTKDYGGTELRQLLGLRSTAFTVTADSTGVTITTRGFGHRVGMSQYGADAMAASGKGYKEILEYYYGGTELILWQPEN